MGPRTGKKSEGRCYSSGSKENQVSNEVKSGGNGGEGGSWRAEAESGTVCCRAPQGVTGESGQ